MCVSIAVSINKHNKSVIKYPKSLPQALPTLPIPRSINPFLLTIINHMHGKIKKTW